MSSTVLRSAPRVARALGANAARAVRPARAFTINARAFGASANFGRLPAGATFHMTRQFSTSGKFEVKTPELGGESITEGTLMEWKVKKGDHVKKDDVIATIETDKVTVDVKAEASGVVTDIIVPVDDNVEVGQLLCTLQVGDAPAGGAPAAAPAAAAAPSAAPAAAAATGEAHKVTTPELGGESITEGALMEWQVKVGDFVKQDDVIALIETDKVTVEVKATGTGTIKELLVEVEATVEVGSDLCVIALGGAPAAGAAAAAPAEAAAAAPAPTPKAAEKPAAAPVAAAPASADNRGERREKMKRMRLAISKNLKESQNTLAMLTTFQEVDMTGVIALRKEYKDIFEQAHGAKLGFMSPFIKASAHALTQYSSINAYIDNKTQEIVYRDYVDIGFAAATPRGLVTPVLRSVQSQTIRSVEENFAALANKAKKDSLTLEEMSGATFTISNGGVFGSMLGTPLIGSTSQSAILGLHSTKMRPVVMKNGSIEARPVMYIALTYDHRLVDGREAVGFLCSVRDQVEDPRRLILEL